MTLNRARIWGILLTTIGVILAVVASLILTNQVKNGGSLFIGSVIGFVVVAPFIFSGAYQFWRGSISDIELNEEMPAQRELMDIVRLHPTSLSQLTTTLKRPEAEILSIIDQLHKLDLFHGYVTPEKQIIYVEVNTIRALTRCAVCGTGVMGKSGEIVACAGCKTDYYL